MSSPLVSSKRCTKMYNCMPVKMGYNYLGATEHNMEVVALIALIEFCKMVYIKCITRLDFSITVHMCTSVHSKTELKKGLKPWIQVTEKGYDWVSFKNNGDWSFI